MNQVTNLNELADTSEFPAVEIFTLNGVTYSVSTKPRVNISLKYLKIARDEGQDAAGGYLLEAILGESAYEALMNYDDLTNDMLQSVIQAAQVIVLGGLEGKKGK